MAEPKKISFGFSKLAKKSNLILASNSIKEPEKKVELIDCLEGQNIKIKDAVVVEDTPLVIPVQGSNKNLLDRVREANELKERSLKKHEELEDTRPDSELTLDELAARQLLREAKNFDGPKKDVKIYSLPAIEDKLALEGSVESTIDDYENVPISEYGLAMLRGMGWKDGQGIGKNARVDPVAAPELRPKGMGLGANKMVSGEKQAKPATDKDGKELSLKKGIHAKVIAGKEKGNYCIIQGLDDEGGRVIVKMALKGDILSFNEFLLIPVTADEYAKCSKILNNAKYEEFKEKTDKQNDKKSGTIKFENSTSSTKQLKNDRSRSRSRSNSTENYKSSKVDNNSPTFDRSKKESSRIIDHGDSRSNVNYKKNDDETSRGSREKSKKYNSETYNKYKKSRDSSSESNYKPNKKHSSSEDDRKSSIYKKNRDSEEEDSVKKSKRDKDKKFQDKDYNKKNQREKDDDERKSKYGKDKKYQKEDNERKSRYDKYRDEEDYERKDKKKKDDSSEDRDRKKDKKDKKKKHKKNKSRSRSRSPRRKSRKNDGYSSDDSEKETSRKKSKKKKSKRRSRSSSSEEEYKKHSKSRRDRSYSSSRDSSLDDRRKNRRNK